MERSKEYEPLILDLQKSKIIPRSKQYAFWSVVAIVVALGAFVTVAALYYPKPKPDGRSITAAAPTPAPTPTLAVTPTVAVTPTPAPTMAVTPTPLPAVVKPAPTPTKPAPTPTAPPTATPTEALGALNLDSAPPNAEVRIGGKLLGQTPLRNYALKPGKYVVKFAYEDQISEQQITITAGQTTELTYRFEGFGSILIRTTRSESEIFVNGELVGLSPFLVEGLAPGDYTIVVRKDGYTTAEKTVTLGKGEHQELLLTIKRLDLIDAPAPTPAPRRPEHPSERPR